MGKTRGVHETTPELRNRMVGMYEAGLGLREIAAAVNCSQRTVKRWLNRFDKEGNVETKERCGRKRATTVEQDEAIVRLAIETPITAAKAVLPALGLKCSVDTVRERLHKAGIHNWSPSRKYMQRLPLGEGGGTAVQHAVWRPTGTQLGKRKSKARSRSCTPRKKATVKKPKEKEAYSTECISAEVPQPTDEHQAFLFSEQNPPHSQTNQIQAPQQTQQQPQPESQPQPQLEPHPPAVSLLTPTQAEFTNALCLIPQHQQVYQHPQVNMVQSWPLDLVQGSQHYSQSEANPLDPNHSSSQLQELRPQQDPPHHVQQLQSSQQIEQRIPDQALEQSTHEQSHHHNIGPPQAQLEVEHQALQQSQEEALGLQLSSPPSDGSLDSDNSSIHTLRNTSKASSISPKQSRVVGKSTNENSSQSRRKKKGGKAKGTLETSVELRNRMIGMSQAGLSTLSIALAIDRSERTVKRWLERWHKEGNVLTKERKGRRRITTKEEDDAIIAMATQHPLTAAKYVAPALGLKCSVDTVRERLHKAGIHSWKLGKKRGGGNAVHSVHLWQPSGNRPNKPKMSAGRKRKSVAYKKQLQAATTSEKRISRKRKSETTAVKAAPPPANMIPEPPPTSLTFHSPGGGMTNYVPSPNIMQPVHTIPGPSPGLIQAQPPLTGPPPGPQPMQPMGPMMQQRPDCRLTPQIGPLQGTTTTAYTSCMIAQNNSHPTHMEQQDPLNYEPYIWSF